MPKYLVVVESPAKAKTINKFLGSKYIVKASYGHVRDLPKSTLGVDVDNDFNPKYVLPRDSSKAVKDIKAAAEKVDHILLATDPDREGEAIGWHIAQILRTKPKSKAKAKPKAKAKTTAKTKTPIWEKPIDRIVFNAITKRSVVEATEAPRPIDEDLVNAQQARRVLDRLVGYKISPLLQRAIRRGLSAGRVQSVAVRMVCEREAEIRAFVPEEYWTLEALLETEKQEQFTAKLSKIRGEKAKVGNEAEMKVIVDAVQNAPFTIQSVERKEVRRRPYAPFITSTLQQDASRQIGFSPRKTMSVAQQLYEGIQLGEQGTEGLITYMRTDSTRLAPEALDEARAYIGENYSPAMLPEKPNVYKSKKGAQDAHEAIRATSARRTPDSVKQYLSPDQLKLYTLIWRRFVACQMMPAVFDQTSIDVNAADYTFRATGTIMKFPGFTALYDEGKDEGDNGKKDKSNGTAQLPDVDEGQKLTQQGLTPEQHFTKPPARFSEATLIRALEANGIGRPSTYHSTLNTIQEVGYVIREKGRLAPTELGEEVNAWLIERFPDIINVEFTANLEGDLDHVEEGRQEWHEMLAAFYKEFGRDVELAKERMVKELLGDEIKCPQCGGEMELREAWYGLFMGCKKHPDCKGTISLRRPSQAEPTDEICDECGAQMVIRAGRFGKFLACSKYPECKNTYNLDKDGNKIKREPRAEPKKTDQKCPKCDGFLLIRQSRSGDEFYGCEKYPKCRFTKPMELNMKCPKCGGELVHKMAKRRRFVGCNNYPECDFTAFGKLEKNSACPKCGNSWTTVTKPRNKPRVRKCPIESCGFEQEIPEEES